MGRVRKPREKLCASAFHPSKTRKTRTQSGRLRAHDNTRTAQSDCFECSVAYRSSIIRWFGPPSRAVQKYWDRFWWKQLQNYYCSLLFLICLWVFFQKTGQNGRLGRQEPPQIISFDETSRMVSVWAWTRKLIFFLFFIVVFASWTDLLVVLSLFFWSDFSKNGRNGRAEGREAPKGA